jgi:hypothetical protein
VSLNGNTLADPDGNEYATNSIHGSLSCFGNSPAPQVGDSEGAPNSVTGAMKGQCAGLWDEAERAFDGRGRVPLSPFLGR